MSLTTTTLQLWPIEAKSILQSKEIDVKQLKCQFKSIYFPWDNEYNTERNYYSLRIQVRPLFIVVTTTNEEIEYILNLAKLHQLSVAICNGRHSTNLINPQILIDMRKFNEIVYRDDILKVGAGATQGQVNDYLFEKNDDIYCHFGRQVNPQTHINAFVGGSAASVGVAGISSAGGVGTLSRQYGLTIDSLLKVELVISPTETKPAQSITVTSEKYSDIFWALTGGSACNFGIVTKLYFKIIHVPNIIEYNIVWDWMYADLILNLWQRSAPNRPVNYEEDMSLLLNELGQPVIALTGFYIPTQNETYQQSINNITNELNYLGGNLTIHPTLKYKEIYQKLVKNRAYHNFSIIQAFFVKDFNSHFLTERVETASKFNMRNVSIGIQLLGGNIKNNNTSTSFAFRNYPFFIDIAVKTNNLAEVEIMSQWESLTSQYFIEQSYYNDRVGMYVGFPNTFNISVPNNIYYGNSYAKLLNIKQKLDPLNILTACGTLFNS